MSNTITLSAVRQCVRDLIGRDLSDEETLFISNWGDEITVRVDRIGSGERWEVVDDTIEDGWWRVKDRTYTHAFRAYEGRLHYATGRAILKSSMQRWYYDLPRTRIGDLTEADIEQIKQARS